MGVVVSARLSPRPRAAAAQTSPCTVSMQMPRRLRGPTQHGLQRHQLHNSSSGGLGHLLPRRLPAPRCRRATPFAALASAQPFAASEPFPQRAPPLLQRQVGSDLDDMFAASPFGTLRRLDDIMEQQFREMDPFGGGGGGPFGSMRRELADMEARLDAAQREMDADIARGLRQLREAPPGVSIERREERAPGSYRYYESIQIRSGAPMTALTPAHAHAAPGLFSPLLFVALVAAGAWAAVTAAFARNYDLTTYSQRSKWKLLLLWPVLALLNRPFWRQFASALRGEQVRIDGDDQAGGGGSATTSTTSTSTTSTNASTGSM